MRITQRSRLLSALSVALLILAVSAVTVSPNYENNWCSVEPQNQNVTVGNSFTVNVWIRKLLAGLMDHFYFHVSWDPSMIAYASRTLTLAPGWSATSETIDSDEYWLSAAGPLYNPDHSWVTITFRCLRPGTTQITPEICVIYVGTAGYGCGCLPGTVNQRSIVGGYVTRVDRFAVFVPYLAFIGLVMTTALAIKMKAKQ